MSRGKRPVVAIGEAKRGAVAAGFMVIGLVADTELPIDFLVCREGITRLVRVRRLKQAGFRIANILRACAQELSELRDQSLLDGVLRELWVRGPARAFHRYRVMPDTVEELGIVAQPKSLKCVKAKPGTDTAVPDPKNLEPPGSAGKIPDAKGSPATEKSPGPSQPVLPGWIPETAGRDGVPDPE